MSQFVTDVVKQRYGEVASSSLSSSDAGVRAVAEAFGYTPEDLASIPPEANMGLSCGNPVALAHLKPGEIVLDLGSGGGLDVFLAARKVGPGGKAIGIDMTPAMIDRARRAAAAGAADGGAVANVEFHLAMIDHLPLPDRCVDVIVSNCVINLAPDKPRVFREMYRVLKSGGRVAVSDIALKKPLPPDIAADVMAYVGCIAGAIAIEDYRAGLAAAGFTGVTVVDSHSDLNAYGKISGQAACCSPAMESPPIPLGQATGVARTCCPGSDAPSLHDGLASIIQHHHLNDFAASVKIYAMKPG